jgi:hypothetical protein
MLAVHNIAVQCCAGTARKEEVADESRSISSLTQIRGQGRAGQGQSIV